jgi:hypothetical protein
MKIAIASLLGACICLVVVPGLAQQVMSGDEAKAFITGRTIEFSDGTATYKADGRYEYYVRANGSTSRGKWSVQGDRVCVDFDGGNSRCDQYVKDGTKISIKTSRGTLYPVTAVK